MTHTFKKKHLSHQIQSNNTALETLNDKCDILHLFEIHLFLHPEFTFVGSAVSFEIIPFITLRVIFKYTLVLALMFNYLCAIRCACMTLTLY